MRRHRGSSGGAACLAYRGAAAAPRAGPLCGEHDSEPGRPGLSGPCARHRARRRRRPRRVLWPPIRVWRRSPRSGKRARPARPAGSVGQSGPGDWPARWTGPADAGGARPLHDIEGLEGLWFLFSFFLFNIYPAVAGRVRTACALRALLFAG